MKLYYRWSKLSSYPILNGCVELQDYKINSLAYVIGGVSEHTIRRHGYWDEKYNGLKFVNTPFVFRKPK